MGKLRTLSGISLKSISVCFTLVFASLLSATAFASATPSTTIVISQVYGAGGNTGSPFNADYIEIFNLSSTPQTLTGWSLQYASATSTVTPIAASSVFALPASVTIPAGGYYLVSGQVTAASTGITVPADYATGMSGSTAGFALSSSSGRVYLVNSTTPVANLAGTDPSVVDFVGFGTAATFEGASAAPLMVNSSATSTGTYDYRTNPCIDTNNNGADFSTTAAAATGASAPHNSSSALHPCSAIAPVAPTATGAATPAIQLQGMSTLLTVKVSPGTGTGIAVVANLSALGGSGAQQLYDDGTHGDATAGDNTFSYTLTIPAAQTPGPYTIAATVTDTQLDTVPTVTIPLTVQQQIAITPIHTIQGTPPSPASTYIGQMVNISGIVTGIRSTGFYLQAKDTDADANPATPEGIYVNTGTAPPAAYVVVGNNLQVTGVVASPTTATGFVASALEIDSPTGYSVLSTGNTLPAAITLTSTNFSATGAYTQLLALQSMRVTAPSVTAVSGTSGTLNEPTETYTSNGQFYGVLTGVARPFRAPGVDIRATLPAGAPAGTTRWTPPANVLQVDSAALGGTAIDLTTGAVLTPTTGVLDYSAGTPLLLISSVTAERPTVTAGTAGSSTTAASSSQLSIAQLNMQRFYNATGGVPGAVTLTATDFARRLRKASAAVRNSLAFPDVVAVQEVENLATLSALAAQISTDATANSQTDPVYVAYVGTDDASGLANGFLVKSTKVNVTGTPVTLATTTSYSDPATGTQPIFDEPPFLLTASVKRGTAAAYPVDVVSAELLPATNINSTTVSGASTVGASVRAKRKAQAEALASGIQSVIGGASTTPVVLACSCNAYEFSDGFVDVVGTLRGNPAAATTVVLADTPGIITTGLTDTTTSLAASDRYVTIENGFADALDHILYSAATPAGTTIAAVHIDADFNVTARNDSATAATTTPFRTSDHDGLVATLQVPAVVAALTFNPSSLSLTFGAQAVGTTSASKPVVVTNTGTTAIAIAGIVASAGFGQTNNCGASLAGGANCTINVTFSPTAAGSPTGSVVLTDSDTTGTQTITLSGNSYNLIVSNTTLTAIPAAPVFTQSVVLTATIPGNGTSVPTGTVTFKDGGTTLGTAVTVVAGSTSGTATYTASGLAAGIHSLTAVYSGDSNFAGSTGALTLTVSPVSSSTTVTASLPSITVGTSETLTAVVTSNLGTPGGTVQFYDGATALGTAQTVNTAGVATYATTALAVGTHTITAIYLPTGGSAYPTSTSPGITITVNPAPVADFSVQISNTQLVIAPSASSVSTSIVVTAINSFAAPVSFTCSGLPAGTSCSFSPATATPAAGFASTTLTISRTSAANHAPGFVERLSKPGLGGSVAFALTLLFVPLAFRKRRAGLRLMALLLVVLAGTQVVAGCGSSNGPPSTSTVTVTATATTGQTHTATTTLITQ